MAVAFVKNVGSATGSMTLTIAVTVPAAGVAAGNTLVLTAGLNVEAAGTSVSDSRGNTWTARHISTAGGTYESYVYECVVGTALQSGDAITFSSSVKTGGGVGVEEFSGVGAFDTKTAAGGTSTTPSSGAITPAAAGLVIGALAIKGSRVVTEDADSAGGDTWHTLTDPGTDGGETHPAYKITTSAVSQTYNPTLDLSDAWEAVILAWSAASTGPTGTFALTAPSAF